LLYPFYCPNCGHKENIEMKMTEYKSDGHLCTKCETEMARTIESMVCGYKDTVGFYGKSGK
jgi:predicted nucleic acid-binding Zn ribbon protein